MRRVLRTMTVPIFKSLSRMVPTWALQSSVPHNPSHRDAAAFGRVVERGDEIVIDARAVVFGGGQGWTLLSVVRLS